MASKTKAVRELLLGLFAQPDVLRIFLSDYDYGDVIDSVNWAAGRLLVYEAVVGELGAAGAFETGTLFDELVEVRPRRSADIDGVRQLVLSGPDSTGRRPSQMQASTEPAALVSTMEPDDEVPTAGLQAILRRGPLFGDPGRLQDAIAQGLRRTATVEIGGLPAGTGFLVGPSHVMSAGHVVGTKAEGPRTRDVVAVFDLYAGDAGVRVPGKVVAYSPPSEHEVTMGPDWAASSDTLDYCLIELADSIGESPGGPALAGQDSAVRGHYEASAVHYDFGSAGVLLAVQYPFGMPQTYSFAYPPFSVSDNRTRVRYNASTLPGSSGSPVFDERGRLVALHHGEGTRTTNEGIALSAIAADLGRRGHGQLVGDT